MRIRITLSDMSTETTRAGVNGPQAEADEHRRIELERRLAQVEEDGSIGTWSLDLRTDEVEWSGGSYRIYGFERRRPAKGPSLDAILDATHVDDRGRIRALIEAVKADPLGAEDLRFSFRVTREDGTVREIEARATIDLDADGRPARWVGTTLDVTEFRQRDRLNRARAVADDVLEHWVSFDESVRSLLERLGSELGYSAGAAWVCGPPRRRLSCRVFWSDPALDVGALEASTRQATFGLGEDVPGHVWATREAVVTNDVARDVRSSCGRVAVGLGLGSGIAFPAITDGGPPVVVSFYSRRRIDDDARLRLALESVGREIGQFLVGRRAEITPNLLSERELQVLELASEGQTGPAIAGTLGISPSTVKTHFEHVYAKLGVNDRAAAVAHGLRTGLLK